MRSAFVVFAFCFVVAIPVAAQDLSIFDKKIPSSEVKTELYVMDVDKGVGEERKVGEDARRYGVDGELAGKTFTNSGFTIETEFTTEFDKDGRVAKRTSKDTYKIGNGEPMTGPARSWEYSYNESGTTVVSKEPQAEGDESAPIVETWKLDASGKMLEYSKMFGEQSLKTAYERDKSGKLLSKTVMYCGEVTSKETCSYREDGTLKESSEGDPQKSWTINRHYDERGQEVKGEMLLGKDGKVERQWVVERKLENHADGSTEEMKIAVHGATADKLEGVIRYVITTTFKK